MFVTLLVTTLWGTLTSMRESMLKSATTLMSGHVNVGGFFKVTAGQSGPLVTHYQDVVKAVQTAIPEDLDYTAVRGRGWAKLISDTASMQTGVGGIDIDKEPGFKKVIQVESGKLEDLAQPNSILIFHDQAEKLGVKVGDALTFSAPTNRGVNNTVDVHVVAIAENVGLLSGFNTYVPSGTLRKLYDLRDDAAGVIYVYLKDVKRAPEVAARLRNALEKDGYRVMDPDPRAFWQKFEVVNREDWTGQKLDVTTWDEEVSFLNWILTGFGFISGLLSFVLLVIVLVGVGNIMWIAVRERTREVGTLRAIGMQRGRVLRMFLTEAVVLGFASGAAGGLLGLLVAAGVNQAQVTLPPFARLFLLNDHLELAMRVGPVVAIVAFITALTTVASAYPAYRAAKLTPVTAMGHAG
ncbi:MAG: ABC transporter permease [Deltaproteobacteria bacterium]|nr:ABC transporter permease [Deltaproteobacteria bacterium]